MTLDSRNTHTQTYLKFSEPYRDQHRLIDAVGARGWHSCDRSLLPEHWHHQRPRPALPKNIDYPFQLNKRIAGQQYIPSGGIPLNAVRLFKEDAINTEDILILSTDDSLLQTSTKPSKNIKTT